MEETKKKKLNIPWKLIFNIVIFGLTIFLVVYFIFSPDGFIDMLESGMKINIFWIVVAVSVHLLNIFLDSTIIYLFLKETTPQIRFKNALITGMTGQFFCAVTPSATGGQPMQILTMSRMGIKASSATSTLIQKFLVWQFTLAAYCIIAVVAKFQLLSELLAGAADMWVFTIVGFAAQIIMIVILLLASFAKKITTTIVNAVLRFLAKLHIIHNVDEKIKSIDETLATFHENNKALQKNKTLLVKVYVITAIQMTSFFLVPYCVANSFGMENCNMFDMLCAQAYVNMVSSLMPLPGGSGAAEYGFQVFFGAYFTACFGPKLANKVIKSAILLWRTITYYGTIAISAPFSLFKEKKTLENVSAKPEAD